MQNLRIGQGYDVHAFASGRELILGGVTIPYVMGLKGHSDADVLIHAIIDSLLGAAGEGDIGTLFPDNDSEYKDISSLILLYKVSQILAQKNCSIINIDSTIICENPKIAPYIEEMKTKLFKATAPCSPLQISIKATTTEGLGFTGREEGIAAFSVSLINIK